MPSLKEVQSENDEKDAIIDEVESILEAAYTPEATRADLVEAVSDALEVLTGEEDDSDDDIDDQTDDE